MATNTHVTPSEGWSLEDNTKLRTPSSDITRERKLLLSPEEIQLLKIAGVVHDIQVRYYKRLKPTKFKGEDAIGDTEGMKAIESLLNEARREGDASGYIRGQVEMLEYMLQCDKDNAEAGHKWSSGDWRKFVQAELDELEGGDK